MRTMAPEDDVEPYYLRLPRLREQAGLSQAELFRRAVGVSFDTIRALEQNPHRLTAGRSRARYPSAATLEALARALRVKPTVFPEYRLARFRAQLDERESDLATAVGRLRELEAALEETTRRMGEQPPPAATNGSPSATARQRRRRRAEDR